jgi:hypothetical protein
MNYPKCNGLEHHKDSFVNGKQRYLAKYVITTTV